MNKKMSSQKGSVIVTVDDFDKTFFPDLFERRQREMEYEESEQNYNRQFLHTPWNWHNLGTSSNPLFAKP
jgi:hypothetical protein